VADRLSRKPLKSKEARNHDWTGAGMKRQSSHIYVVTPGSLWGHLTGCTMKTGADHGQ
jgi:hypothetical protein